MKHCRQGSVTWLKSQKSKLPASLAEDLTEKELQRLAKDRVFGNNLTVWGVMGSLHVRIVIWMVVNGSLVKDDIISAGEGKLTYRIHLHTYNDFSYESARLEGHYEFVRVNAVQNSPAGLTERLLLEAVQHLG